MASMSYELPEREMLRTQVLRDELADRIAQAVPVDGPCEPLKGVRLYRSSRPSRILYSVYDPALCLLAQGSKVVLVGEQRFRYDAFHYLLATVEVPVASQIIEASKERPYLSLRLMLDPAVVTSVMVESGHALSRSRSDVSAFDVSPLSSDLLDAAVRLIRLLDSPAEAPVLAPLITREIIYRLLAGEQGGRLRHVAVLGGHGHRVVKAIEQLHKNFDQPLRIEEIAGELGMSTSAFHHRFKAVTGISPLQFQKQLRLQEARRLMLAEDLDATTAGYRVGYDNVSQFSREYKRLFGEPPMRDVERVREAEAEGAL